MKRRDSHLFQFQNKIPQMAPDKLSKELFSNVK